jgi:hypothetical protein
VSATIRAPFATVSNRLEAWRQGIASEGGSDHQDQAASFVTGPARDWGMTNMAWRIVLAGYVASYLVAIAIERHGLANLSHRGQMTALELFLTAPFAWGYVAYALQRGSIHWSSLWRSTTLERDDRPVAYWLAVGFVFFYGALLIVLGLNR